MPSYALHLLGSPRLEVDGIPAHIGRRKAMALLAYLAVTGTVHTRDALSTLLWPEFAAADARAELRRQLVLLNDLLGPDAIEADRETVQLNPDLDLRLDVTAFRAQLGACAGHGHSPTEACPDCVPLLEGAVALYTDPFMAGFTLGDSAAFDEWQFFQTEALKDEVASGLVRLATYYTSQGDFERAIDHARRWLALDPLHEPAHRHLMVLYAKSNQRTAALRQYETCERLLREEFGVEPSARTQGVYQQILKGEALLAPTAVEAVLEREARQVGPCPYRGLAAFGEADAPFYFGREAFVEQLELAVSTRPFVALVVGASGSGKSSVVAAGLIPRLRGHGTWQVVSLRPGREPFQALARALLPAIDPDLGEVDRLYQARQLADRLESDKVPLIDVTRRVRERRADGARLLLVVDQFEELYTLCPDAQAQRHFVDTLLEAVDASEASDRGADPQTLLVILRADFMGRAISHRPLADALQKTGKILGPMTRDELRVAIVKPAEKQGAAFEAGLVDRLLDGVGEEPGNLPLLEFALTLLWQRLDFGWMTHAAYEAIARVEGALARYADEVYAALSAEEQGTARRIFTQLVQPGQGTEDTRRVATRADVGEGAWDVVQHLADQRLVVTGRDQTTGAETVEVVHEVLIRNWGKLQAWMAQDRAFRTWQERLRVNLRQWEESNRDEGALLAGVPLEVAKNWQTERRDDLSCAETSYIEEGKALQARRQKERQRRRQRTLLGLVAGLVIAIVAAVVASIQRGVSMRQAAILLAEKAVTELANNQDDRAVLLALTAAEDLPYTSQAEHALGQAVSYSRAILQYTEHASAVLSVAWSPDGKRVASIDYDTTVRVWDPVTGEALLVVHPPPPTPTGRRASYDYHQWLGWTQDGSRLYTLTGNRWWPGWEGYNLWVWDASDGALERAPVPEVDVRVADADWTYRTYPVGAMADIAPHSGRLVTLGETASVLVWDEGCEKPVRVLSYENPAISVDWSPDETRLAVIDFYGVVAIWDVQTGQTLLTLEDFGKRTNWVLWSPDGSQIATGGKDGVVRIWNGSDGSLVGSIETHSGEVCGLAWAPSGQRIAVAHIEGSLRIWEVATGRLLETLRDSQPQVTDLQWSPVDDQLAVADVSGSVWIWNVAPSAAWRVYPPQAVRGGDWTVQGASWSNDSRYLAVAGGDAMHATDPPSFALWDVRANQLVMENLGDALGRDGYLAQFSPDDRAILYLGVSGLSDLSGFATAYVFDARTAQITHTFTPGGGALIRCATWSPDGSQVATGLWKGDVLIWDYETGKQTTRLVHADGPAMALSVEWSPDGSRIAAATRDSDVHVWDTSTWQPLYTVRHEPPAIPRTATWSPDGSRLLTTASSDEEEPRDTVARIWDAESGEELLVFRGHSGSVLSGDWSPDGKRIASFGSDGTVKIWDSSTGDELLTITVPVLLDGYVAWSPDGQQLAIFGGETLVSVWRVWQSEDELIDYAKECCVVRELTETERWLYGLTASKPPER